VQLSVIILNYNVRYFLELCVLSVQAATKNIDAEIIVVDNNSQDDSCDMIKSRFPTVILIENDINSGFPRGNNIGVNQAKGEYICILNPDTVVAEDTFTGIMAFAENKKNLGIIGCKLIDGTGNFLPESKRGLPTPFVAFTKIIGFYKIFPETFGKYYATHISKNETSAVDILVGAFMLMKRELYLEVGGFDERCFMYADDIDLSYMVLKSGKTNFYFHDTTVIHYKGESTIKDGTYMKRSQEAMNFFFRKHFKFSLLFSLFMEIGIVFFSLLKMFRASPKAKLSPDNYGIVSTDESLKQKVENRYEKPVFLISSSEFIKKSNATEIVFDTRYTNFKTIISSLEENTNKNLTFKIFLQSSNFMIGSNTSFDRGEVVQL
jgi:GT2 family glycosyltransferase